jgi:valyl-tRNA synthetase
MRATFPALEEALSPIAFDPDAAEQMTLVMAVINAIRNIRGEMGISPSLALKVLIQSGDEKTRQLLTQNQEFIVNIARLNDLAITPAGEKPKATATAVADQALILVYLEGIIDFGKEVARLEKEVAKAAGELEKLDKKLANPGFVNQAKPEVVDKVREQRQEYAEKCDKLALNLEKIKSIQAG